MNASIGEQVRARMKAALLAGNTDAGANVYRARETSFTRGNVPAIMIMANKLDAKPFSERVDSNVDNINLQFYVRGDVWETLVDQLASQAHQVLLHDAQVLGLVASIRRSGELYEADEADQTAGMLTRTYAVKYLSRVDDVTSSNAAP